MSTIPQDPKNAATEGGVPDAGTSPISPTVTHYQQLADEFSRRLDEIIAIIPRLEAAHKTTSSFVRGHQNISNAFLATAISEVERYEQLKAVNKLDPPQSRDVLQFLDAFGPVLDKVSAFRKMLHFTLMARKATLAAGALQIYYLAKGLARDANSAELVSAVENLKRDLRKRKQPKEAAPAKEVRPANGTGPRS
jgi:ABC-type transporter Mla subunit MlaD